MQHLHTKHPLYKRKLWVFKRQWKRKLDVVCLECLLASDSPDLRPDVSVCIWVVCLHIRPSVQIL